MVVDGDGNVDGAGRVVVAGGASDPAVAEPDAAGATADPAVAEPAFVLVVTTSGFAAGSTCMFTVPVSTGSGLTAVATGGSVPPVISAITANTATPISDAMINRRRFGSLAS